MSQNQKLYHLTKTSEAILKKISLNRVMPEFCGPKALVDPNFLNIKPDLIVVGKETEFLVNRINLLCISPYFQTILRYECLRDSDGYYRLDMSEVSAWVLAEILNYAKYGRVDVNENNVIELLTTSDKYNIRAIIQICQYFLQENLNSQNCLETYLLAHYYNCQDLKILATDFIFAFKLVSDEEQPPHPLTVDIVLDLYYKTRIK